MQKIITTLIAVSYLTLSAREKQLDYPIVDTDVIRCYDNHQEMKFPKKNQDFYGQDAHYQGSQPSYRNNGDGTISDLVTRLTWSQSPGEKMTLKQAQKAAKKCRLGGFSDWRVPTIKELYSLIVFTGLDPNPQSRDTNGLKPFIDTDYFDFQYGREEKGERIIDSQYGSSTKYVGTTMGGKATLFGVNFADGRIKGYGLQSPRSKADKEFYFIFVRGNKNYGKNQFVRQKNGTIFDKATNLTWMAVDSAKLKAGPDKNGELNWQQALEWAEDLRYAGKSDWRLPNIKELQSIIDYKRSPQTTNSPAIHPFFQLTPIIDEGGQKNWAHYWSSSTHLSTRGASTADYMTFGEGLGWMTNRRNGEKTLMDVHGAGAQRSDPKDGNHRDYPYGRGPQGDVIRIQNLVICVRGGNYKLITKGPKIEQNSFSHNPRNERSSNNRSKRNDFTRRLDKNNDGQISQDEFDGPKKHFKHLDKDGDGFISADEAPSGPPKKR